MGVSSPTPARGLQSGRGQGYIKDEPGPRPTRISAPRKVQPCLPFPSMPGQALPTLHPGSVPRPPLLASSIPVSVCPVGLPSPWGIALGKRCPEWVNPFTSDSRVRNYFHPTDGETEAPGEVTCSRALS